MTETIVFISPKIDETMRQKIAESLRIRGIAITDKMQNATLVIADVAQPVKRISIADFAIKLVNNKIQEVLTMKREILLFNQKTQKIKSNLNMPLKQFNQIKQINRKNFLTRTNCK